MPRTAPWAPELLKEEDDDAVFYVLGGDDVRRFADVFAKCHTLTHIEKQKMSQATTGYFSTLKRFHGKLLTVEEYAQRAISVLAMASINVLLIFTVA